MSNLGTKIYVSGKLKYVHTYLFAYKLLILVQCPKTAKIFHYFLLL